MFAYMRFFACMIYCLGLMFFILLNKVEKTANLCYNDNIKGVVMKLWFIYGEEISSQQIFKNYLNDVEFFDIKNLQIVNEENILKLFCKGEKVGCLPDVVVFNVFNQTLKQFFERKACKVVVDANLKVLSQEYFAGLQKMFGKYKNFLKQKRELTILNNSFEILAGKNNVMFSAPHNVKQIRDLQVKPLDTGTGNLVLNLANLSDSHAIIKTNCMGVENVIDDDANYEESHPYKFALKRHIIQNQIKFLFDIHAMKPTRTEQVNIGIFGGHNIQNNFALLNEIIAIFNEFGFEVWVDQPFKAGPRTVAHFVAKETQIFAVQVEINSSLINHKNEDQQFEKMTECFLRIVEKLNEI